jgi:PAS domain S-box-containing protein
MGMPHVTVELNEIQRLHDAETALEQSLETFRSAFEYATIGKALVGIDGRWLRVNRALCAILGYVQTELLSLSFQDITHPDDLSADLVYVQQLLAGDIDTYQMEKRYIHADGHSVWCLLSVSLVRGKQDQPVYFVSQIQDITERKNSEQALVASELRFRSVVENSPVGILARDIDGRVVTHNAAALKCLGSQKNNCITR